VREGKGNKEREIPLNWHVLAGAKAFAAHPDECRHSVRISHGVRNAG
jgi:hypothetical protein